MAALEAVLKTITILAEQEVAPTALRELVADLTERYAHILGNTA